MPRTSDRRKLINQVTQIVQIRQTASLLRSMEDCSDSNEDILDASTQLLLLHLKSNRYSKSRKRRNRNFFDWVDCVSYKSQRFNEVEFLQTFRITRQSFWLLHDQLKESTYFQQKKHSDPAITRLLFQQLLVFLYRIGMEGSSGSASNIAAFFGIGYGSVQRYVQNITKAVLEFEDKVITWPNEQEKEEMKARIQGSGFRHCIGIIDGTLVFLSRKPSVSAESYYSRKCAYAVNVTIVCDDRSRITYYYAGWPGSTHDNRVFRNSRLFTCKEKYFNFLEYLLGDSAYSVCSVMVQAFKKSKNEPDLSPEKEYFNTMLGSLRIKSEHCIGMLKGRFPCLKRLNIAIKERKDMKRLVELVGACCVLHNMFLDYKDTCPHEWYEEIKHNTCWDLYNEEVEEDMCQVGEDDKDRRLYVYNSIIANYY